jgi:predicted O-methyltransferase YrrM
VSEVAAAKLAPTPAQYEGQLDNGDLEELVKGIVERQNWKGGRSRTVVEVGTGGGRGSTVAIHRALTASNCRFQLFGYEGNPELALHASQYWSSAQDVHVVNEFFMHREDIEVMVKPRIAPADRASYLPHFEAVAATGNFLATPPPSPIDLLFVDSVRYTHLPILRAAEPWLQAETVVVMEDDIPELGELAIIKSELELRKVATHETGQSLWPFVEFRVVPEGSLSVWRRLNRRVRRPAPRQ